MPREILGTTDEQDAIEQIRTRIATADGGEESGIEHSGPADLVEAKYEADLLDLGVDPEKTQLHFQSRQGRATYRISNARQIMADADPDGGMQELSAVDVIRPWYTAPYFQTLTIEEIAAVRQAIEDGVTNPVGVLSGEKSYQLFGHMIRGDNYYETAYLFRRTFRTNSNQAVLIAAGNINTVVDLPKLTMRLRNLIDALPTGEWLKRPVTIRYLGRDGWEISDEYLWAPQWSIVYGGTFTGEDPE